MTVGELSLLVGLLANAAAILGIGVINLMHIRGLRVVADQTHLATNSMKDELVKEVREASMAKGVLQGKREGKAK